MAFGVRFLDAQEDVRRWIKAGLFPKNISLAIFTGTDDQVITPEGSYFLEKHIDGARLYTYEGAYHSLVNELPDTTEEFYKDFINVINSATDRQ